MKREKLPNTPAAAARSPGTVETYPTKREALQREYAIKRLPRAKKRELIEKGNRCDEDSE